ncbi:MAG: VWA domain-containing protein, partial [Vicinamibacterales bacterium]
MDVPRIARSRATALLAVATWLVCHAPVTRASQAATPQQPTFTAGTLLVELDVTVTDDEGRPVRGLGKEDFVLRENGDVQPLDRADFVDVPMLAPRPAGSPAPVVFPPPDVASNAAVDAPPRAYVFVLDDLLTRASRTARLRDAVERFIRDGMSPGDSGAVAFTGSESSAQDFTTDQARLIDAVQRFTGRAAATPADNIVGDGASSPAPLLPDFENVHNNLRTFDTLANAVMALSRLSGPRRAIVFVSEAHGLVFGDRDDKGADAGRLLGLAAAHNVVIHVVDPSGLTGPKDDGGIGTAVIRPGEVLGRSSSYGVAAIGPEGLDDLRSLATQTGGVAVINTNGLQQGFARIVQASSAYYHLAYYPADTTPDGKFRRLDVSVNREGVHVLARRSFVIEKPAKKKAGMSKPDELLSSPLPVVGLGLHAQAAVLRKGKKGARAIVVIDVDGADLAFEERGARRREALEFWVVAIDSSGRVRDRDSGVSELTLAPERAAETTKRGLRLVADLSLGKGRYRVRIAARERQAGRAGSVFLDLDVPDFGKGGPHASSLLLTSAEEGRRPAFDRNTSALADLLPALPTATRRFTLDDSLALLVEAYTAPGGMPPPCRLDL